MQTIKSWRTTLGGSLETLGSGLRDGTLLISLAQVGTGDELHKLNLYAAIAGTALNMVGKFFSNLFAADQATVVQMIAKAGGDTSTWEKKP